MEDPQSSLASWQDKSMRNLVSKYKVEIIRRRYWMSTSGLYIPHALAYVYTSHVFLYTYNTYIYIQHRHTINTHTDNTLPQAYTPPPHTYDRVSLCSQK